MNKFLIFALSVCLAAGQSTYDCPVSVPRDNYLRVFGDSCFRFVLYHERTHSLARRECESHGGTLVLVKSQAIQDFLVHTLANDYHDFNDKLWIGLNDIDREDVFKWEDGTPLGYSHWALGEGPDSTSWGHSWNHDENDCVVMNMADSGKWGEYPCEESSFLFFFTQDEEHSFICQYVLTHPLATTEAINAYTTDAVNAYTTDSVNAYTTEAQTLEVSTDHTSFDTTTNAEISGMADTTVVVLTNPCPAFSCDLDCGTGGFQKNSTTGCFVCQCASS